MVEQNVEDLANIAEAALKDIKGPPPAPLPRGWVLKESRSQPDYYYYYHQETGVSSWQPPPSTPKEEAKQDASPVSRKRDAPSRSNNPAVTLKPEVDAKSTKRARLPTQVRALHILKKHRDSKRPKSWRNSNITISRDEAVEELQGLVELLQEVQNDPAELRATFEELARTESDCSSAKRGGDLGFFETKKMQKPFEDAAFGLEIGAMSGIVDTASGVHVILRVG